MEKEKLRQLAEKLSETSHEEETYILTSEEEKSVLEYEIDSAKKHKAWRLAQFGLSEYEIISKISQVNWEEEINKSDILKKSNSSKHASLWHKEQREKEKLSEISRIEEMRKVCDAKYFYNLMKWTSKSVYDKHFIRNDDNTSFIVAVCYFFGKDPRFETDLNYSFKKGLLLRGPAGLGKTHLIKCIAENPITPVNIVSTLEINQVVQSDGEYRPYLPIDGCIYLDDMGTEEKYVMHYGTKISWVKNYLEMFYLKTNEFNRLIVSTNNNFQEIEEKYGFRIRSRMKDMFNIIDVSGTDMRG